MKKLARRKSKRVSTRQRIKTEKKVREYNRKVKKEKRKNPGKFSKSKKDPGVPNACPFKEKVLQEVEEAKQRKVEEKVQRRERLKLLRKEAKNKAVEEKRKSGFDVSDKDAFKKLEELEKTLKIERELKQRMADRSARAFFKQFGKMVEECDVIIQVLDARDPIGTRCKEVETKVLEASKRILLVLNKADLVPRENLAEWLQCLRKEFPTVAVKSAPKESDPSNVKTVGVPTLVSLLSAFCQNKNVESPIKVGVVGLPNVGKACFVRSIMKARGIEAGDDSTELDIDPKIKLIAKPGMILASGLSTDPDIAIRNFVTDGSDSDPMTAVTAILNRCPKPFLMMHFNISTFDSAEEFLTLVSLKMKKLKKGGTPTTSMAAKFVLKEWNSGKIKFFTKVPETPRPEHVSDEAVAEHAKDFSFNKLESLEKTDLEKFPIVLPSETTEIESFGMVAVAAKQEEVREQDEEEGSDLSTDEDDSDEDDDEMDVEDESEVLQKMVEATKSRSKKKPETLPAFAQEKLDRKKKVDRLKEKKTRKSAENVEPKQKKFPKSKNGNRMKIENYDFNDF